MEEQPVLGTATMKPEGVSGWEMELNHGRMPEQHANQRVEIWPSWKQKSYGILRAVGLQVIATVRKRSYGKVMFLHMSDIPFTWDEVYTP